MSQSFSLSWSNIKVKSSLSRVSPEKLSNYDLILLCQEQAEPDRTAFSELLKRYQSHVNKVLYHLAPEWNDRADLAQEVWIRVYRNIKRLQDPKKFQGWLSTITTNLFYDELRKRKRIARPLSLDAPRRINDEQISWDLPSDSPSPDDDLTTQEFYDRLRQAIAKLPENYRQTIILREIQGLSYGEIATITGVTLGTVKSRIARAREQLQGLLQEYLSEG